MKLSAVQVMHEVRHISALARQIQELKAVELNLNQSVPSIKVLEDFQELLNRMKKPVQQPQASDANFTTLPSTSKSQ